MCKTAFKCGMTACLDMFKSSEFLMLFQSYTVNAVCDEMKQRFSRTYSTAQYTGQMY